MDGKGAVAGTDNGHGDVQPGQRHPGGDLIPPVIGHAGGVVHMFKGHLLVGHGQIAVTGTGNDDQLVFRVMADVEPETQVRGVDSLAEQDRAVVGVEADLQNAVLPAEVSHAVPFFCVLLQISTEGLPFVILVSHYFLPFPM